MTRLQGTFTHADRTSGNTPQLIPIQRDGRFSKQLKELRRLAYEYTEPGPGRDSTYADAHLMAVAYIRVAQAHLATTVASAGGDR